VFIFAHELGHALHFALTGDIDVLPDSYDRFNDMLKIGMGSVGEKREGFADAVAYAIIGSGLQTHLPAEFHKEAAQIFIKYIQLLCGKQSRA